MIRSCIIFMVALAFITPVAVADDKADVEAACRTQTWIAGSSCPCFAQHAMTELNNDQRAWLVASGTQDTAEVARLEGEMPQAELAALGLFVAMTPGKCP